MFWHSLLLGYSWLLPWAGHHGHEVLHVEAVPVSVHPLHHHLALRQAVALPELQQHVPQLLRADPPVSVAIVHKERLLDVAHPHPLLVHLHELAEIYEPVFVRIRSPHHISGQLTRLIGRLPQLLEQPLEILRADLPVWARHLPEHFLHVVDVRLEGKQHVGELPVFEGQPLHGLQWELG